jgi:hypothetical protein
MQISDIPDFNELCAHYTMESPFLKHVNAQFHGVFASEMARRVASKEHAAEFIRKHDGYAPKEYGSFAILEDAKSAFGQMPDRFAFKFSAAHSGIGIFLLERIPDKQGSYWCHMTRRIWTIDQLIENQKDLLGRFKSERASWIFEEFIAPAISNISIPFDYKLYCFNGSVGVIIQIDRNSKPARVSAFDGNFVPLTYGVDYWLDSKNWVLGQPVIPYHAMEMLAQAKKFSKLIESPFVSVDCYDAERGPVIGEFTFGPGAVQNKMMVLSNRYLDSINRLFEGFQTKEANKLEISRPRRFDEVLSSLSDENIDLEIYKRLAWHSWCGDPNAAEKLASHFGDVTGAQSNYLKMLWAWIATRENNPESYEKLALRLERLRYIDNVEAQRYFDLAIEGYKSFVGKHDWFNLRLVRLLKKRNQGDDFILAQNILGFLCDKGYRLAKVEREKWND